MEIRGRHVVRKTAAIEREKKRYIREISICIKKSLNRDKKRKGKEGQIREKGRQERKGIC